MVALDALDSLLDPRNQAEIIEDLTRAVMLLGETRTGLAKAQRDKPRWWRFRARRRYAWRVLAWTARVAERERAVERIVGILVQTSAIFHARAVKWESKRRDRRQAGLDRALQEQQAFCDAMNAGKEQPS